MPGFFMPEIHEKVTSILNKDSKSNVFPLIQHSNTVAKAKVVPRFVPRFGLGYPPQNQHNGINSLHCFVFTSLLRNTQRCDFYRPGDDQPHYRVMPPYQGAMLFDTLGRVRTLPGKSSPALSILKMQVHRRHLSGTLFANCNSRAMQF